MVHAGAAGPDRADRARDARTRSPWSSSRAGSGRGHRPGQYLRVGMAVDGVHHWRAYSITSDPGRAGRLHQHHAEARRAGQGVAVPGPQARARGDRAARRRRGRPSRCPTPVPERLLFISAGSGITPIMSMLRSLDREGGCATSCTCTPRAPRDDVIFGGQLRRLDDAPPRLPAARAADRRARPHRARRTSTSCAPTGASARPSSAGPAEMLDALTEHWTSGPATPAACTWSASSPSSATATASTGDGGTIRFCTSERRGRVRRLDADPRRRRGGRRDAAVRLPHGHLPHLRRAALLRPGSATCAPARSTARRARWSAPASTRPRARSRSTCDPTSEEPHGHALIESPLARLTPEQIEELGREFDAIHDEVFAELGDRDRRYITSMIEMHRRLVVLGRVLLLALALPAGLGRRDRDAVAGQDPREHGDRPQRHARPVGLDERPADQLLHLGLGLGLDRRGLEALPQLRAPHVHEHPRQGPRPRLRDHADRPAPEVAPGLPLPAVLQPAAGGVLRVGRRDPRPRLRGDPDGREVQGAAHARAQGHGAQGAQPDRQGLRRVPLLSGWRSSARGRRASARGAGRSRAPRVRARRAPPFRSTWRRLHRERRPQRVGLRDHLLRPLPRPDVHLQPGGGRRRDAAAGATSASCSAPRTSRAARSSTSISGNLGYQVEHHLYPDMPSTRYARDRPARAGDLRALRAARTTPGRSSSSSARVQRTILRLAFPGGKPRPKPGPYRGEPVAT